LAWETYSGAENYGLDSESHKTASVTAEGKPDGHPFKRDASFAERRTLERSGSLQSAASGVAYSAQA